jgi:polyisoprenoid-binding protein YceI
VAAPAGDGEAGAAGGADGLWQVRAGDDTFVGYRVTEQLAFAQSPNDAVGRTGAVTGTMRVDGDQVPEARIEADLRELRSDEARRDNAIRRAGLESERFPTAAFELTEPLVLDGPVAAGKAHAGEGRGRLTLHGTTRDVTIPLQGRWDGDTIQVTGRLPVRLTDFGIQPPRIGPVVSIADAATIELQLVLTRS